MRRLLQATTLALAIAGTSCQAGAPQPTPQTAEDAATRAADARREADPDALPKALDRLKLTVAQQEQVKGLIAQLKLDLSRAKQQRDVFKDAMIAATRGCSADDSRLHIEAGRMNAVGNEARPVVLDAINAFHAILTPEQRALLVDPILSGDVPIGEDTESGREKGFGKVAEALDLSFTQKLRLVQRALERLSITTETTSELRAQALTAAAAFKRDNFDIREHAIAKAPVVKLYTRLILDLAQVILPVLDREQCDTAAGLLHDMFEKKPNARPASVPEKASEPANETTPPNEATPPSEAPPSEAPPSEATSAP